MIAEPSCDATALAAAIRSGETTAVAAMTAALDRVAARADLGALRLVDADMGMAAAAAFDALLARRSRRASGASFGGVPFLMKDLGNAAAGLPNAGCCRAIIDRLPADRAVQADSLLARRFRRAGLLPFGLTTTPELALDLTSEPPGLAPARNPWDPDRLSPGGSSGGAAAAVAAGLVAIAHATDACGSIRVPAAACGLYGLKPTRGATPNGPTFANELLGFVGELVLARSPRDVRAALVAAAGEAAGFSPDPTFDDAPADGEPLRIGVVDAAPGIAAIGDDEAAAIAAAASTLEAAGHHVDTVDAGTIARLAEEAMAVDALVLTVSVADWMAAIDPAPGEISPLAEAIRRRGDATPATALFSAMRQAASVAHRLWSLFDHHDVLILPALAAGAPRLGAFPHDNSDVGGHFRRMLETAPYMALANISGAPALALPFGLSAAGLPVGLQLVGPMGCDLTLLALAETLAIARRPSFPAPIAGLPS